MHKRFVVAITRMELMLGVGGYYCYPMVLKYLGLHVKTLPSISAGMVFTTLRLPIVGLLIV